MTDASPQLTLFARSVLAHLRLWPSLRLALTNSEIQVSNSPVQLFASEIVELFASAKSPSGPEAEDVEDLLLQVMEEEFETVVDDDSQSQISQRLILAWRGLNDPNAQVAVSLLEEEAERVGRNRMTVESRDDIEEESEDDEEEEDEGNVQMDVDEAPMLVERAPRPPPEVDEDGFTLVTKKGRR